jgi:hypothetical protein
LNTGVQGDVKMIAEQDHDALTWFSGQRAKGKAWSLAF